MNELEDLTKINKEFNRKLKRLVDLDTLSAYQDKYFELSMTKEGFLNSCVVQIFYKNVAKQHIIQKEEDPTFMAEVKNFKFKREYDDNSDPNSDYEIEFKDFPIDKVFEKIKTLSYFNEVLDNNSLILNTVKSLVACIDGKIRFSLIGITIGVYMDYNPLKVKMLNSLLRRYNFNVTKTSFSNIVAIKEME